MASLTRVAYVSRKLIRFGGWGLVGFVFLWTGMTAAIRAYLAANPVELPATRRYGLLPKIIFPEKKFEKKEFRAELADDTFPAFDDQVKIYVIYRPDRDFLALEYDKNVAKNLGFGGEGKELKYGVYEFKENNLNQTLTMDVLEGSFVLKYPYLEDQTLLVLGRVPDEAEAISIASAYLETAGKFGSDLENGEQRVGYWKIEYDGLKSEPTRTDANVARVDFFRSQIDEIKVVGVQPGRAPVTVLVSGAEMASKKVIEMNYKSMEIDNESYSTYPIKTVEEAWSDLTRGNYWPAYDTDNEAVVINEVYLAYFEPVVLTHFLQPVFVFEGRDNFVAYVTAVVESEVE